MFCPVSRCIHCGAFINEDGADASGSALCPEDEFYGVHQDPLTLERD